MARYAVRSLTPGAFATSGAIAGGLIAAVPGVLLASLTIAAVHGARSTLETWRAVRLPAPAPLPSPTADMVDLLHLTTWLTALRAWDASPAFLFAVIAAAVLFIGAVVGALGALLAVLLFNLGAAAGGGPVVELAPLPND